MTNDAAVTGDEPTSEPAKAPANEPAKTPENERAKTPANERAKAPANAPAKEPSLWGYFKVVISAVLLIFIVALGLAVIVIPALTHSVPLTVLTSSMEPGLPPGTLLIVRPVDPEDIRIGDVVTYQPVSDDPAVITHRVIEITHTADGDLRFTFQGDNNNAPDPEQVIPDQIQGRVWYSVPWVGWVNNTVSGDTRSIIIPVAAGALLLYAAWAIGSGLWDRRKNRAG